MTRKPTEIEYIFVIRLKTEKESGEDKKQVVNIDSYRGHPSYSVLLKHKPVFQQKLPSCLPPIERGVHEINVDTKEAIFLEVIPSTRKVIRDSVEEMLAAGLIRPSTSPHGAPTFCVKKPVGWRIVHDYRALNMHTIRRTLPMSRKDKIIDKMQGAYWFSCMNVFSGYYQFRVRESDVPFTALQAPDGAYEYLVLQWVSQPPPTFNAGVRRMLTDFSDICESYVDDIYVYTKSQSIEKHLEALDRVLTRLEEKHYFVKLSKCVFCVDAIPCLGDYVGRNGVCIDPAKVKILRDWPLPRTRNELQSFLGTAVYVRRFCNDFASDTAPLFDVQRKRKTET
ncbi:LOW QUALITY PROTEIN: Reverse transcriptase [Phytophthora palmivora]|uniref:Reverse transcriptase n=1 Tax=Phytophthora palmivora TaxID=4796 RepID=A0A2P4WXI5_9STRA|nr:LOW QUALITY PROTEIN: Reverse transcriptase [Phytophthora palmivora]